MTDPLKPKRSRRKPSPTIAASDGDAAAAPVETAELLGVPLADVADNPPSIDGEIRLRAYEIYLSRGGADGNELADWLEAERIVAQSRKADNARVDTGNHTPPPA